MVTESMMVLGGDIKVEGRAEGVFAKNERRLTPNNLAAIQIEKIAK